MVREKDANEADICPAPNQSGGALESYFRLNIPCSAAELVAGDSANKSRSRRKAADCFKAVLNSEFYDEC